MNYRNGKLHGEVYTLTQGEQGREQHQAYYNEEPVGVHTTKDAHGKILSRVAFVLPHKTSDDKVKEVEAMLVGDLRLADDEQLMHADDAPEIDEQATARARWKKGALVNSGFAECRPPNEMCNAQRYFLGVTKNGGYLIQDRSMGSQRLTEPYVLLNERDVTKRIGLATMTHESVHGKYTVYYNSGDSLYKTEEYYRGQRVGIWRVYTPFSTQPVVSEVNYGYPVEKIMQEGARQDAHKNVP